jgi:hypothetical protein
MKKKEQVCKKCRMLNRPITQKKCDEGDGIHEWEDHPQKGGRYVEKKR